MKQSIQSLSKQFGPTTLVGNGPAHFIVHCQVVHLEKRMAANNKPFFDIHFADGGEPLKLKVWNNSPAYPQCEKAKKGEFVAVDGMFKVGEYGIEATGFSMAELLPEQIEALLRGSPEQIERVEKGWSVIRALIETMRCDFLRGLSLRFIETVGEDNFKRAGAARGIHHARRGGLVEHVSEMMRMADAICLVYPALNRSLLLAGALMHDSGKLVENQFEKEGFGMPFSASAELYGHIAIGLQILQGIWVEIVDERDVTLQERKARLMEDRKIKDALSHLILSHHGTHEWGSPVEPRMPEAQALHFIDNISAKLEIMRAGIDGASEVAPDVFDCPWPMKKNLVRTPPESVDRPQDYAPDPAIGSPVNQEEPIRCGYHDRAGRMGRCILRAGHALDHEF